MWRKSLRGCVSGMIVIGAAMLGTSSADAQTDLATLSDEELVKHFEDRPGYKAEFQRRVSEYSPEGQSEARELLMRERFKKDSPPEESTDKDLIASVRSSNDPNAAQKALEALRVRYVDASASEQAGLYEALRTEYRAMPYPDHVGITPPKAEDFAQLDAWRGLTSVAKACLPEAVALKLLREFYLDSGRKSAITQFLAEIKGEPFTGTPTLEVLQEISERVGGYDATKLNELGEHETLGGILVTRLSQFGDAGFEELKATPWQRSGSGVYTMGRFKNPEARALLLDLYASLPDEYRQSGKRLEILTALMTQWDRERDTAFREMLRVELTKVLEMNHNENPITWTDAVQLIEHTGDPWFVPKLKECRENLDYAEIRRASTLPQPEIYLEKTIEGLQKALAHAIVTLEKK